QPPVSPGPVLSHPGVSRPQREPDDEVKADLLKSRRFSTSPQLPSLTRVSGFGDDLFSNSGGYNSQTSSNLPTPSEEPQSLSTKTNLHPTKAAIMKGAEKEQPSALQKPSLMSNSNINLPATEGKVVAAQGDTTIDTRQ